MISKNGVQNLLLTWFIWVFFGSVITYYAFLYALKRVNPSQISMLNYVNTIIAIFLGWLILDEKITTKFIFAAILIISGVFIMNLKKEMFKSRKPEV